MFAALLPTIFLFSLLSSSILADYSTTLENLSLFAETHHWRLPIVYGRRVKKPAFAIPIDSCVYRLGKGAMGTVFRLKSKNGSSIAVKRFTAAADAERDFYLMTLLARLSESASADGLKIPLVGRTDTHELQLPWIKGVPLSQVLENQATPAEIRGNLVELYVKRVAEYIALLKEEFLNMRWAGPKSMSEVGTMRENNLVYALYLIPGSDLIIFFKPSNVIVQKGFDMYLADPR
jgi:hypothetical protein